MAGYYSATQQHNAAAPLADFCTAAYTNELAQLNAQERQLAEQLGVAA